MTIPDTGGRWLRDSKTGALTPLLDGDGAAPVPALPEIPRTETTRHEADAPPDEAPAPTRKGK